MIILACNGVLVDGRRISAEAAAEAFTEAGLPVSAHAFDLAFCGWPIRDVCLDCESRTGRGFTPDFSAAVHDAILRRFQQNLTRVVHIEHALAWLRQPRCVISEWPRALALESLRIAGLAKLFDDGRLFTHDEARSAHPLSYVATRVGEPASRCILVTQSPHDIVDCARLGMTAIGFSGNTADDEAHERRLRDAGAALVIHDMRRLRDAVATVRDITSWRRGNKKAALAIQRY